MKKAKRTVSELKSSRELLGLPAEITATDAVDFTESEVDSAIERLIDSDIERFNVSELSATEIANLPTPIAAMASNIPTEAINKMLVEIKPGPKESWLKKFLRKHKK